MGAITRGMTSSSQSVTLVPIVVSVAGLLITGIRKFQKTRRVLSREERILRVLEIVALMVMLFSSLACTWKVGGDILAEARSHGSAVGISMCAVAGFRGRMYCLEVKSPVSE